jgi:hypothetical protein
MTDTNTEMMYHNSNNTNNVTFISNYTGSFTEQGSNGIKLMDNDKNINMTGNKIREGKMYEAQNSTENKLMEGNVSFQSSHISQEQNSKVHNLVKGNVSFQSNHINQSEVLLLASNVNKTDDDNNGSTVNVHNIDEQYSSVNHTFPSVNISDASLDNSSINISDHNENISQDHMSNRTKRSISNFVNSSEMPDNITVQTSNLSPSQDFALQPYTEWAEREMKHTFIIAMLNVYLQDYEEDRVLLDCYNLQGYVGKCMSDLECEDE